MCWWQVARAELDKVHGQVRVAQEAADQKAQETRWGDTWLGALSSIVCVVFIPVVPKRQWLLTHELHSPANTWLHCK